MEEEHLHGKMEVYMKEHSMRDGCMGKEHLLTQKDINIKERLLKIRSKGMENYNIIRGNILGNLKTA